MTMFRLTARGLMQRPRLEPTAAEGGADASRARGSAGARSSSSAKGGMAEADIYDFEQLAPGNRLTGPAVIHTPITTIVRAGRADAPHGRLPQHRASRCDALSRPWIR